MLKKLRRKIQKRLKSILRKVVPRKGRDGEILQYNEESVGNRLPPELLHIIFEDATCVPGAMDTAVFIPKFSKENEYHRLKERRFTARSLALVCRQWKNAANFYLYRMILIDSEDSLPLLARTVTSPTTRIYGTYTHRLDVILATSGALLRQSLPICLLAMTELVVFRWRNPPGTPPTPYDQIYEKTTRPHYILDLLPNLSPTIRVLDCVDGLPRLARWELRALLKRWPFLETLTFPMYEERGESDTVGSPFKLQKLRSLDISQMDTVPLGIMEDLRSLEQIEDSVRNPRHEEYRVYKIAFTMRSYYDQIRSFVLKVNPRAAFSDVGHYIENITRQMPNLVNFTLILDDMKQFPHDVTFNYIMFLGIGFTDPRAERHGPLDDEDDRYRRFFKILATIAPPTYFRALYFLDDCLHYHPQWEQHKTWPAVARTLIDFPWEILDRDSHSIVPFPPNRSRIRTMSMRVKRMIENHPPIISPPDPFPWE